MNSMGLAETLCINVVHRGVNAGLTSCGATVGLVTDRYAYGLQAASRIIVVFSRGITAGGAAGEAVARIFQPGG